MVKLVHYTLLVFAILFSVGPSSAQDTDTETPMTHTHLDRTIDYVEFAVTDMDAAKKFYAQVFDWEFTDYGPDYASFTDDRLDGGFRLESEVAPGGPLIIFYATDLESVEARIREAGGSIVQGIFSFPGGRRFHFSDPSGNELAVWSDQGATEP